MSGWEMTAIPVCAIAIMVLVPPSRLYLSESVFAVLAATYNAWVTRSRGAYVWLGIAVGLVMLVLLLPPLSPAGTPSK